MLQGPCAGTTTADQLGRGSSAATVGGFKPPKLSMSWESVLTATHGEKDFADVVALRNLS